jgi:hypothetical protein
MSGPPETPEGIAFILWIASLAAAFDPGNAAAKAKADAVIELYLKCRHAADEARPTQHERGLLQ